MFEKVCRLVAGTWLAVGMGAVGMAYAAAGPGSAAGGDIALAKPAAMPDGGAAWKQAAADARREHRPRLAYFRFSWDPACRQMDGALADKKVMEALGSYIIVRLDAAAPGGAALASWFGIRAYPALLFLDSDGHVADLLEGPRTQSEVFTAVKRIQDEMRELGPLDDAVRAHPQDAPSILRLASILIHRQRVHDALTLIQPLESQSPPPPGLALIDIDLGQRAADEFRIKDAEGWYEKALRIARDPGVLSDIYFRLSYCQFRDGGPAAAAADLRKITGLSGLPDEARQRADALLKLYDDMIKPALPARAGPDGPPAPAGPE
jgi:thioredoxin-like negative regulator of GroEL